MTRPLARSSWFPMRQAVLHLSRPGNQTRVILLTVGLGTFFIMGVRGLQVNLLNQFALQIGDNTPDMFLVDIQQDQAADMKAFLAERLPQESQPLLIPVLARACHRQGWQSRRGRRPAGARHAVAGVHDYLSRPARVERDAVEGHVSEADSGRRSADDRAGRPKMQTARGLDRGGHRRALRHRRRRRHALRRAGPLDPRAGQRHPARRVARRAERGIHVRLRRGHLRERAALVLRAGPREPGRCGAARQVHARSRRALSECLGHRPSGAARGGAEGVSGRHGRHRRRRHARRS